MELKQITIITLFFGLFIFNTPLKAYYQPIENSISTDRTTSLFSKKKLKSKSRLTKWLNKSLSKSSDDTAKKIRRNSNLALGFGFGAFVSLFLTVAIFQLVFLFIITALALIMGFIFAVKTRRQIKAADEDFFQEKSKTKIGLIFSLITLLVPVLVTIITLAFWW